MKVVHNKLNSCTERTYLFQSILGTGSIKLLAKIQGMSGFTLIKEFTTDEMVAVDLPNGQWKAEITGDAELGISQ
ncbi:hypothetical protein ALT721_800061 [Alteromonas alvinellae]